MKWDFDYLSGRLALINTCVLPVLTIVLASSLHRDRRAPLALAAELSLSFVVLGLGITALGPALGLDTDTVVHIAAVVMVGFALVMLVLALSGQFSAATAGLAARAIATKPSLTAELPQSFPHARLPSRASQAPPGPSPGPTRSAHRHTQVGHSGGPGAETTAGAASRNDLED